MRLLVTGGAGFIGSNFIRRWLERHPQDSIVNIDLLTYAGDSASLGDVAERYSGYVFARGDIADGDFVSKVIEQHRPNVMVNFAAEDLCRPATRA